MHSSFAQYHHVMVVQVLRSSQISSVSLLSDELVLLSEELVLLSELLLLLVEESLHR